MVLTFVGGEIELLTTLSPVKFLFQGPIITSLASGCFCLDVVWTHLGFSSTQSSWASIRLV